MFGFLINNLINNKKNNNKPYIAVVVCFISHVESMKAVNLLFIPLQMASNVSCLGRL